MKPSKFDQQLVQVFLEVKNHAEMAGINRINSPMLLAGFLHADESPIYNAIFEQVDCTYFSEIVGDCWDLIMAYRDEENAEKSTQEEEDKVDFARIYLKINNENTYVLEFGDDLYDWVVGISEILEKEETVDIYKATKLLIECMPIPVLTVLRSFGVDIKQLKAYFGLAEQEYSCNTEKKFEIPKELKSFVKNFNEELKGKKCDISGRDTECESVWQTLQKRTKRNVILIGEPGVGKTSIAEKIAFDILAGNCPEEFKNMQVLSLDVNSSIAGTMYRGQAEERYSILSEFLANRTDVILFIDEIHLIRGAGATKEGEADLANAIKPILAGNNVRVIGATTVEEYEKYFSQDGAIKRRFRPIEVKEPKMSEVYSMLKKTIETLSQYHGVKISRKIVDFIILNSACFNYETRNPDRTKDLIDLSMVVAKNKKKTTVDKEDVLDVFKYNFEKFKKMTEYDKLSVAYHEAGHAIVTIYSEFLKNESVIAVSIMPSDQYLGVTVTEPNDTFVESTMEYYIDLIAKNLAGRVAETIFTKKINSGASQDLKNATKIAEKVITEYGMSDIGVNRIYSKELSDERTLNSINEQIDALIKQGTKRAEELLVQNNKSLTKLAKTLVEKGIVSEAELKQLFEKKKVKV